MGQSVETSKSSGLLAAGTTAVQAQQCKLSALILIPAAADCTVLVYDNKSAASGTVVLELSGKANAASSSLNMVLPAECLNGATVVVTGAGAQAILHYSLM